MQKIRSVLNIIDSLNDRFGRLVSLLIVPMFAVVTYEVVMRYGFNNPTDWAFETTQFVFGSYVVLAGAYALLHGSHVNMDIIYGRFSPRAKAVVDLFTSGLFFFFVIVLVWLGIKAGWDSVQLQETSGTPWDPIVYPVRLMIPLAAFLLLLQGAAKFIRDLVVATGREVG